MRSFLKKDIETVNDWQKKRNLPPVHCLPEIGFIVENVACGFLHTAECGVAFLEAFFTNPDADAGARNAALFRLSRSLLGMAEMLDIKRVMVITSEKQLADRANLIGFSPTKLEVLIKELGE